MLGVLLGLRAACQRGDLQTNRDLARGAHGLPCSDAFARRLSELWIRGDHYRLVPRSLFRREAIGEWWLVSLSLRFLSLSIFVNYFQHRNDIRDQVWGGAPLEARIDSVARHG